MFFHPVDQLDPPSVIGFFDFSGRRVFENALAHSAVLLYGLHTIPPDHFRFNPRYDTEEKSYDTRQAKWPPLQFSPFSDREQTLNLMFRSHKRSKKQAWQIVAVGVYLSCLSDHHRVQAPALATLAHCKQWTALVGRCPTSIATAGFCIMAALDLCQSHEIPCIRFRDLWRGLPFFTLLTMFQCCRIACSLLPISSSISRSPLDTRSSVRI